MMLDEWTPAAVVFDCDGLLVDTETCWSIAESAIFARHGLPYGPEQKALVIGKSVRDAAELMAGAFETPGEAENIANELVTRVATIIEDSAQPMKGAVDVVRRLKKGVPIAVATNSPRLLLDIALRRGGFADSFPVSVTADEVRNPKPAPDIYLEACSRLGVRPEQALAFEDSMTGARAARAAGLRVICIPSLPGLDYPADAIFPSLDDSRLLSWLARLY